MTLFQIIALYIALNLIMLPVLMYRVGQIRIKEKVSIGDGNSPALMARIRAHGNYAETAPFALIGLIALGMLQAHPIVLHVFGAGFLLSRLLHAHGMAQAGANGKGRMYGTILTLLTFVGTAVTLLWLIFTGSGA